MQLVLGEAEGAVILNNKFEAKADDVPAPHVNDNEPENVAPHENGGPSTLFSGYTLNIPEEKEPEIPEEREPEKGAETKTMIN